MKDLCGQKVGMIHGEEQIVVDLVERSSCSSICLLVANPLFVDESCILI